mgnify:CR=1 FL=1
MKKIIGVRFKKPGKIYFFDPGNLEINKNDNVIVETTMGEEIGIVIVPKREIQEEKMATPLKKVIRVANKNDLDSLEKYKKKEPEALRICKEKIKKMMQERGDADEDDMSVCVSNEQCENCPNYTESYFCGFATPYCKLQGKEITHNVY